LKNTLEYLGLWEHLNNPAFKGVEFDPLLRDAGSNAFTMSPTRWVEHTELIGSATILYKLWLTLLICANLTWDIAQNDDLGNLITDNAFTKPDTDNNTVHITIGSTFANRASGFFIAQTMIHEAIHAEMWRQINSVGGVKGLSPNNFFQLWENYHQTVDPNSFPGTPQHNDMANNYRDQIILGLRDYDLSVNKYDRAEEDYTALSWAGLMGTTEWNAFKQNNNALATKYLNLIALYYNYKEDFESKDCTKSNNKLIQ